MLLKCKSLAVNKIVVRQLNSSYNSNNGHLGSRPFVLYMEVVPL